MFHNKMAYGSVHLSADNKLSNKLTNYTLVFNIHF